MTLKEEIEKTLTENSKRAERPEFRRLSSFYEERKKAGTVLRRQYDLPSLDTVSDETSQKASDNLASRRIFHFDIRC